MNRSPIIALDFNSAEKTFDFLKAFDHSVNVKVGMELYYKEGPAMIARLKEEGYSIFLDLKLHDIPNTVKSAMNVLASLEVDMVNVHAAGGKAMLEAALEGLDIGTPAGKQRPALIAVTQLTSTDDRQVREEQLIGVPLQQSVEHYAKLASSAHLDGVVCSVQEAKIIEEVCGKEFFKVTPGIRLAQGEVHDQKRVATPAKAREEGSTHIVVGRAITGAENPRQAYESVKTLWEGTPQ
ncbi:orotidine 5'-phosphate decarboxylase [Sporosarcina newyorkensis 2681]|uniref:Orotidine 5'-phosphate decarboxylase n=1 Tax=Sporosarcina newyorkensis 2681 TaxID=1027292 RepID=F9DPG9_9BACL|nr:orotidine-5'-phosphate decarboxylase [Sporosarcina newyorkensis]EGQ27251.1 orotidine 5'-phosphate decarboxylase [Sporosarcina newyorkensis 2681]